MESLTAKTAPKQPRHRILVVIYVEDGGTLSESALLDGELPVPIRERALFLGWFTETEGGEKVNSPLVITNTTTLYAHWLTEVAMPIVTHRGETVFSTDSCEVTISCATEGATIYYTNDGTTPRKNNDYLYTGPVTIDDTTTFKAIAVVGNLQSSYVTVTITKKQPTLDEALDVGPAVAVATYQDAPWTSVFDSSAKIGNRSARSGAIGDRACTWLSATVEGAGMLSFWCKTSCEHDEDGTFTWDRLMIYTNDVEIVEWRMDGETDWAERVLSFDGGVNTVKWVYDKDRTGAEGEDCAWIDEVVWTPSGSIPIVAEDAAPETVTNAIEAAGFADSGVKDVIGGSAAEYIAFKNWAQSVKGLGGANGAIAGEAAVVANTNAAAAYLLGVWRWRKRLVGKPPYLDREHCRERR